MQSFASIMRQELRQVLRRPARLAYQLAYRLLLIYWRVFRPATRGAYVAVWFGDELLMIRNTYKLCDTFPAGGVGAGESTREAAVRELSEEVGIRAVASELTFVGRYVSHSEYKHDTCDVFELRCHDRPRICEDGMEVAHARWLTIADVADQPVSDIVRQYLNELAV